MFLFTIAFLLGDLYLQTFSALPSTVWVLLTLAAGGVFFFLLHKKISYSYLPFAFLFGLFWSSWYAHQHLSWSLNKSWEGVPLVATGYVASIPQSNGQQMSFDFKLETLTFNQEVNVPHALIKLSLRNPKPALHVGDKWRFIVRLKRIHTTQNIAAFDFEKWSLEKGLRATGSVVPNTEKVLLNHSIFFHPIDQYRQWLLGKITHILPQTKTSSWLLALMIGERQNIPQKDWEILRKTGTNHLMAIAGLHIGVVAGLTNFIVSWCFRRRQVWLLKLPAQYAGALAAIVMAWFYSALAGFALPTERACLMLSIYLLILLAKRNTSAWTSWSIAVIIILFLNPLAVLSESFWLSIGTIALIIYGMSGRLAQETYWWKWGRAQWVIGLGLIPLSLIFFQQCSLISFFANSIAIPWLSFLILPLCFLSMVLLFISPYVAHLCLLLADKSLAYLWDLLVWFSQFDFAVWNHSIASPIIFIIITIGFIILLLPAGVPGRGLAFICFLPLFITSAPRPKAGDYCLNLLDVEQGLSVVVQTKNHILVFDTGAKINDEIDMGKNVVVPFLSNLDIQKIDLLVVSHGDNDHSGGVRALQEAFQIDSIMTSVPDKTTSPVTELCLAGYHWRWDEVDFEFLYPGTQDLQLGNDSSCVLKVSNGTHSVLLTGDIEEYAERRILLNNAEKLSSDILVAPHHGSKTSGISEFISAVHPSIVLYATGYRNKYHFPHAPIIKAYESIGAQQFETAQTGMMQFKISKENPISRPYIYRIAHHRYWMDT